LAFSPETTKFFSDAYEVFLLFMVPIGGGIPAGVVVGDSRGLSWPTMCVLYFFSDVILACLFDPAMRFFLKLGRKNPAVGNAKEIFKKSVQLSTAQYGPKPGPFVLVLIAFGVDPMTGRAATHMAGHGFLSGWAIAITGDMFFFLVVMASTLWLNNILGDGTWTAIIVTLFILFFPLVFKKIKALVWRA
jgi:uncharacterized membrane protein